MGPVWVEPPEVKLKGYFNGGKKCFSFFFHKSFLINTVNFPFWLPSLNGGPRCLRVLPWALVILLIKAVSHTAQECSQVTAVCSFLPKKTQ